MLRAVFGRNRLRLVGEEVERNGAYLQNADARDSCAFVDKSIRTPSSSNGQCRAQFKNGMRHRASGNRGDYVWAEIWPDRSCSRVFVSPNVPCYSVCFVG